MRKWMRGIGALALLLALVLALTGCGADAGIIDLPTETASGTEASQPEVTDAGDKTAPEEPEPSDNLGVDDGEIEEPVSTSEATVDENEEPSCAPVFAIDNEEQPPEDETPNNDVPEIDEYGEYNSAEDVALYLHIYGHLPGNYITKNEARDLGWNGGSVENYAPGCAIGGDTFGNREGVLPEGRYHECDIDTIGENSRGAKRLVYSDDGRIYYTEDHYESFILLYGEE